MTASPNKFYVSNHLDYLETKLYSRIVKKAACLTLTVCEGVLKQFSLRNMVYTLSLFQLIAYKFFSLKVLRPPVAANVHK